MEVASIAAKHRAGTCLLRASTQGISGIGMSCSITVSPWARRVLKVWSWGRASYCAVDRYI